MSVRNQLGFATRCIHAGQSPDPTTGAVMMPIYATSTFAQESPGVQPLVRHQHERHLPAKPLQRRGGVRQGAIGVLNLCVDASGHRFVGAQPPQHGLGDARLPRGDALP